MPPSKAVLPHDTVAEETVIGLCLRDPDCVAELLTLTGPDDFFNNRHGMVFEAIKAVYERGDETNETTVGHELNRRSRLEAIGGQARLAQYVADLSGSADGSYFAELIRRDATYRRIISASENISKLALQRSDDLDETVSGAYGFLEAAVAESAQAKIIPLSDVVSQDYDDFLMRLDNPSLITGLSWGSEALDQMTGGLKNGMFYIIAGRPSMGKTSYTVSVAMRLARAGIPTLYFTREMPPKEIKDRMAHAMAGVDWNAVRAGRLTLSPAKRQELLDAMAAMRRYPLFFDYTSSDAATMKMRIREGVRRHGVKIVFVDHIDITSARAGGYSGNRNGEVMQITAALKAAAMDNDIPVVGLSQLSREVERRQDKMPQLADLRDGGSKEQDAQGVILLFRPVYYEKDEEGKRSFREPYRHLNDLLIVNLAKNTYGPTGLVGYKFHEGTGQCYGLSSHDSAKALGNYEDFLESQDS